MLGGPNTDGSESDGLQGLAVCRYPLDRAEEGMTLERSGLGGHERDHTGQLTECGDQGRLTGLAKGRVGDGLNLGQIPRLLIANDQGIASE